MSVTNPCFFPFFLVLLSLVFPPEAFARIGESREELERRLIRESDRGLEVDDNDLEEFHRSRSPFFERLSVLEEDDWDYVVYHKINEDVIPSSQRLWKEDHRGRRSDQPEPRPEGWLLHVAYLNGVSVLEYYIRSKPLTPPETEGILSRNADGSEWKTGRPPKDRTDAVRPRIFPVNHYRADFGVYAAVGSDTILLYDPRLDRRVHETEMEVALEEAPVSLDGF